MRSGDRPDDFEMRRRHLRAMSDAELHAYFWQLVEKIVAPLIEEARTHTTPSIERSILLRMGLSSTEAKLLVAKFQERALLGHGAGRLVLELARTRGMPIRDAAAGLSAGRYWEDLAR